MVSRTLDSILDRGYSACNMRLRLLAPAAAVLALLALACTSDGDAPAELVFERDVTYCTIAGVDLRLDITYRRGSGDAVPMIMHIHGGGWADGDKSFGGTYPLPTLAERGYVVASINHRRAPEFYYPAQLEDAKCAVRFLRANAARYGGDPDRIGVWGASSGGQLAAMLGLTEPADGYDGAGDHQDVSSEVQAVVSLFAPSDLTDPNMFPQGRILVRAFGTDDRAAPLLSAASSVNYTREGAPPFLLIHGDRDGLVPLSQSEQLDAHLRANGIESTLIVVRNANHNFAAEGGVPNPGPDVIEDAILAFFVKTLGEP